MMSIINMSMRLPGTVGSRTRTRTLHQPLVHAHAHYPDIHHRHPH